VIGTHPPYPTRRSSDLKSIPSNKFPFPNVKRGVPVCASIPIVTAMSPNTPEINALIADPSERLDMAANPINMSAKYSTGPNETRSEENTSELQPRVEHG